MCSPDETPMQTRQRRGINSRISGTRRRPFRRVVSRCNSIPTGSHYNRLLRPQRRHYQERLPLRMAPLRKAWDNIPNIPHIPRRRIASKARWLYPRRIR